MTHYFTKTEILALMRANPGMGDVRVHRVRVQRPMATRWPWWKRLAWWRRFTRWLNRRGV